MSSFELLEKREFLNTGEKVVKDVAGIIEGYPQGYPPEGLRLCVAKDILPQPPADGPRANTDFPEAKKLSDEQITRIRQYAEELGIDSPEDLGMDSVGLTDGSVVIAEPGLISKQYAQLLALSNNGDIARLGAVFIPADTNNPFKNAYISRLEQVTAHVGVETPKVEEMDELKAGVFAASLIPGFEAIEDGNVDFGYSQASGKTVKVVEWDTGQLKHVGNILGTPIITVNLDRWERDGLDSSGERLTGFDRPGIGELTELAAKVGANLSSSEEPPEVAGFTSSLYNFSRRILNPDMKMLSYGTKTLEEATGQPASQAALNQIGAELWVIADAIEQVIERQIDESLLRCDDLSSFILPHVVSVEIQNSLKNPETYVSDVDEALVRIAEFSESRSLTERAHSGVEQYGKDDFCQGPYEYIDENGDVKVVEEDGEEWTRFSARSGLSYFGRDDLIGFFEE